MSQAGPEQQRLSPAERANLVAYLDGELNDAETQAIATKLTNSPTARREVDVLTKTWELLDHLPRPVVSSHFTERTLTEVRKIDERGGRFEAAFVRGLQALIRVSAWLAPAVAALVLGFVLTRWVWPDTSARLARDLSIAEHLDEYREVGSFDLLDGLASSPEFSSDHAE